MTLIEIVQEILSEMDGDEVNSISDTEESEQVARIVVAAYRNVVTNSDWYTNRRALKLVPRADSNYPTHTRLPDNVKELHFINYDTRKLGEERKHYQEVKWKSPDDFLRYLNMRDNTSNNVMVVQDDSGIDLLIITDKAPQYWTSFDDKDIIFDSYDSVADSWIQSSKMQAQGIILPTLALEDDAVPELPPDAVAMFIEKCKSVAQYKVRQFQDVMSEREQTKQNRWVSRNQWRAKGGIRYPNYGRKSVGYRDPTFGRK